MLEDANVPNSFRKLLMPEAVKTATQLDGLIPIELDGVFQTKYKHQFGKNPTFANSLRAFGEAGTVTIKSRTFQPKDKGRGVTCMMVGYSQEHPSGTYRMFDPLTKGIHITRDVTWLRRTFFHPTSVLEVGEGIQAPTSSVTIEPLDDDAEANTETADADDDANVEAADDDDDEVEPTDNVTTTRSGRTINLPSYLRENYEVGNAAQDYKIELTAAEERYYEAMEFGFSCLEHNGVEEAMVGAGIGGGFTNTNELHTMKYDTAMSSPDKKKWEEAIANEYKNMREHGVFEAVDSSSLTKDAKVLSTTWVLKKKANGVYKGRITARGYEQQDGEHYDSNDKASPVVNDITIRIALVLIVMGSLWAEIVDVKGAFLTADFEPHHKI
jgi:Reverse transcriptase (RNA-dependent DNA polymerase)